jgi:hypothetical protein
VLDISQETTPKKIMPEPAASARSASLVYVSDEEAGIRRRRAGKGFSYTTPEGERLSDLEALARIKSLAIPPAWTDVWISPVEDSHLQATGRDQRGRKQYRYHPRWSACRDEVKYSSLVDFAKALPRLRAHVDDDLKKPGLSPERVVASVVWLLDNTMIRVGNSAYARDNNSFGLTTLRDRHVKIDGSEIRFAFKGKSGKEWNLRLVDRRARRTGTAGPATFSVQDRGCRAQRRALAGRERVYSAGKRPGLQFETLPHLGRHDQRRLALCRHAGSRHQVGGRAGDQRDRRPRRCTARQYANGLP